MKKENLKLLNKLDLLWFAGEDEGRTEEPSEHKKKKSREEGKIPKSQDLSGSLVMLIVSLTLVSLSEYIFLTIKEMFEFYFTIAPQLLELDNRYIFVQALNYLLKIILPILIIAVITGIVVNIAQVGFLIAPKALKPDFKKIVPDFVKYIKKSFFSSESIFNLIKSLLKVFIIGGFSYYNIYYNIKYFSVLMRKSLSFSLDFIVKELSYLFIQVTIIFIVIGLIDFIFQKRQHLNSLKMTKQEVKEEHKTFEGNPLVKQRLRQRMREILTQNITKIIPQADVIIANPTHFSVALEYKSTTMKAPTVIAKGQDHLAFRIKELAKTNNIPIMENKFLARSLYNEIDIGDEIPPKYYEAVIVILKEVYKLNKEKRNN